MARPSLRTLASLARAAQICYLDADPCRTAGRGIELEVECFFDTPVEAFVARPPGMQVVAFRGTEIGELQDLLADVNAHPRRPWGVRRRGPGTFHPGFADAGDSVFPMLRGAIDPRLPLFLAGHSYGAALATYFAARLIWEEPGAWTIAGLTAGSPRTCNGAFAEWFDAALGESWVRAAHNNDIVTRLPTSITGYRHVGLLAWIEHDGDIAWEPGAWDRFRDRLVGRWESLLGAPDVREVPGVDGEIFELLERRGMAVLHRLLAPAAVATLTGYGVPAPIAQRLVAWAADRTHGGTIFDGLHDHSSELYARAFERAAVQEAPGLV
jgi:hypothetical protein